jgi:hypothetical protein
MIIKSDILSKHQRCFLFAYLGGDPEISEKASILDTSEGCTLPGYSFFSVLLLYSTVHAIITIDSHSLIS